MKGTILAIVDSAKIGFITTDRGDEIFFDCRELDRMERTKFKGGSKVRFERDSPGSPAHDIHLVRA